MKLLTSIAFFAVIFGVSTTSNAPRKRRETNTELAEKARWRRDRYNGHLQVAERTKRRALANKDMYWFPRVIPYEIATSYTQEQRELILKSIDEWQERTCVTFRPKQADDKDYVYIKPGDNGNCDAIQGKAGGKQILNLAVPGCVWKTTILHELGHTLGLSHEHQHPNRDKFINLVRENVKPAAMEWMETLKADEHDYFGMNFDMDSVMTYSSWANAKGKERTMVTKDPSLQHRLDNYHKFLSYSDVAIVNKMEKCENLCKEDVQCPKDSYLDKNCKCITPQLYFDEHCKNTGGEDYCFKQVAAGKCKDDDQVVEKCTKMCDLCPMYHVPRKHWTGGCENKYYQEEECDKWAKAGHCNNASYKKFMVTWCSKACGTCDVNPDCLDTGVCNYNKDNCKPESEYHDWMMQNCKNYCGQGPKSCERTKNTAPVEPTSTSEDSNSSYGNDGFLDCEDTEDCSLYEQEYTESSDYYP